jgi:hypothetical protein
MVSRVESSRTDQAIRITGVSRRRLAYWMDRGIVSADIDEALGHGRVRFRKFRNLLEVRAVLPSRPPLAAAHWTGSSRNLRKAGLRSPLATVRFAVIAGGGVPTLLSMPSGRFSGRVRRLVQFRVGLVWSARAGGCGAWPG